MAAKSSIAPPASAESIDALIDRFEARSEERWGPSGEDRPMVLDILKQMIEISRYYNGQLGRNVPDDAPENDTKGHRVTD